MKSLRTQEHADVRARSGPALYRHRYRRTARLPLLSAGVLLFGCSPHGRSGPAPEVPDPGQRRDLEIVSLTEVSGSVNGSAFEGQISATIQTGHGGISSCSFSALPDRVTPGTFAPHT